MIIVPKSISPPFFMRGHEIVVNRVKIYLVWRILSRDFCSGFSPPPGWEPFLGFHGLRLVFRTLCLFVNSACSSYSLRIKYGVNSGGYPECIEKTGFPFSRE
jgi:hypothetical protein